MKPQTNPPAARYAGWPKTPYRTEAVSTFSPKPFHLFRDEVLVMGSKRLAAQPDTQVIEFEPLRVAELIEACRAHTASLQDIANTASEALHEFFEYEIDEPHLGTCIDVVKQLLDEVLRQLLDRVLTALPPLGIVEHDADPAHRAMEIAAGCEAQRQQLLRARHITLATIYTLRSSVEQCLEVNATIESLRDLEGGVREVFDGLNPLALGLPTPSMN